MKLEDQVCSLELSKRLKELGVKQDSLFVWISIIKTDFDFIKLRESFDPDSEEIGGYNYAAFTVAELGEILPKELISSCFGRDVGFYYTQMPDAGCTKWIIFYRNSMGSLNGCEADDELEANARGKMLIYLLENKLMELSNET